MSPLWTGVPGAPAVESALPNGGPAADESAPAPAAVVREACPPLAGAVEDLRETVAAVYEEVGDEVDGSVHADGRVAPGTVEAAVERAGLVPALRAALRGAVREAVETAADHAARRLGAELTDRLAAPDASVAVTAAPADSFAAGYGRRQADCAATALGAAARRYLREAIAAPPAASPPDVARVVDGALAVLAGVHPPLVAGAATLWGLRLGVQAVAETVEVVAGKRWAVPDSGCPVHADPGDRTAGVEECFAVPGASPTADRPPCVYVVGEDRPFACRCLLRPVLGEVPAHDPRALAAAGVRVTLGGEPVEPLTAREREVAREHARPGEPFEELVRHVHDEHSVAGGARELGVTKKTLYRWFDKYVEGFDRYSGR